jgi:RimJ/RimL family protein N-acetyltransferase
MTDLFRSARLTYRAVKPEEDLAFFQSIHADRLGYQNSNPTNTHLPTRDDARDFMSAVSYPLLGAIICLPSPPGPESEGSLPKTPVAIGQIHLQAPGRYESRHRHSEVAIQILPEWQERGYGSEAIEWILSYAFLRAGLHCVAIRVFAWNEGAVRLYERLGFVVEGRERQKFWYEGKWCDDVVLRMLEGEWRARERGKGQ